MRLWNFMSTITRFQDYLFNRVQKGMIWTIDSPKLML